MPASQIDASIRDRMRDDWNARAREDVHYYVAFGRRDQDDSEFFSTAADVVRDLEDELKRSRDTTPIQERRALEIGCGPGRLLRPMSRHFGEIHGVDVSDEMIAQARHRLRDITSVHLHAGTGSDLSQFPDDHFDFVYSYAVFQHIPSHEVVFSYLAEAVRVLKPGGFARLQINGLPKSAAHYTTWEGVRIGADEIHEFTQHHGIRLLSLTGVETQYMWTSWQKPPLAERVPAGPACIRHVANAFSSEQPVPNTGRTACASILIENLPPACDLNTLEALIDAVPGTPCYVGSPVYGLAEFKVFLPDGVRTGLVPVLIRWRGGQLCPEGTIRVIPAGPSVPRLVSVSDGVNLLSPQRIDSGTIKVTLEEAEAVHTFRATVDGVPVSDLGTFRTDPLCSRYEVNFRLPPGTPLGGHVLDLSLGNRLLTRMGIEVI